MFSKMIVPRNNTFKVSPDMKWSIQILPVEFTVYLSCLVVILTVLTDYDKIFQLKTQG